MPKERLTQPENSNEPDPNELPAVYASTCRGECLEPYYHDGDCLVFSKDEPAHAGDFVGVWLRPHAKPEAKPLRWVKRLAMEIMPGTTFPFALSPGSEIEPLVVLEMLRPERTYQIPARDVLAMHKVVGKAVPHGDGTASLIPGNSALSP